MFDIHTHVLPFVDDGSKTLEDSLAMLFEAEKQGVTDMVITPHFRKDYAVLPQEIKQAFAKLSAAAHDAGVGVKLYVGQEFFINNDFKKDIADGKMLTIGGGKAVLIEFDYDLDTDIAEVVYQLKSMGYIPIVAHFERYKYADISVAEEIKALGGYIQINADGFFGKSKKRYYKKIKELIKNGLVDFVASDVHTFRGNYMLKAYNFVVKKFGEKTAAAVFTENAKQLING